MSRHTLIPNISLGFEAIPAKGSAQNPAHNTTVFRTSRPGKKGKMYNYFNELAEGGGFEPPVRLDIVRRFSKPLV